MDILFISRCLPYPLHYGDRLLSYHVVSELRARGHRFDLLAFYLEESDLLEIPRFAGLFTHIEPIREKIRSPLDYLKRLALPFPDSSRECWNPSMWEAIQRRLADQRYDLIHLFGGVQIYENRNLVRGLPNIIVPYDSHGLFMKRAVDSADSLWNRMRLQAESAMVDRYERTMYEGFDRVVLVAENDEKYLHRLTPRLNTTVIPMGVDTDYFSPKVDAHRASTMVFVGNYEYAPNVSAAIALIQEILPRVRRTIPDARAILVGANPPAALKSLAGDGVEITGYVPDIRPYLAQAACFVAPLTLGSGMKDKVLEAMAMRIPVVATSIGCEGIAATPGEDILFGRTNAELADAVIRLLRDDAVWRKVAEGGRRLVDRLYNWRSVGAQYEKLYADVIAQRRAGVSDK
jgi:glycosyltransferase involved in cell wall biosynthesis